MKNSRDGEMRKIMSTQRKQKHMKKLVMPDKI